MPVEKRETESVGAALDRGRTRTPTRVTGSRIRCHVEHVEPLEARRARAWRALGRPLCATMPPPPSGEAGGSNASDVKAHKLSRSVADTLPTRGFGDEDDQENEPR